MVRQTPIMVSCSSLTSGSHTHCQDPRIFLLPSMPSCMEAGLPMPPFACLCLSRLRSTNYFGCGFCASLSRDLLWSDRPEGLPTSFLTDDFWMAKDVHLCFVWRSLSSHVLSQADSSVLARLSTSLWLREKIIRYPVQDQVLYDSGLGISLRACRAVR